MDIKFIRDCDRSSVRESDSELRVKFVRNERERFRDW